MTSPSPTYCIPLTYLEAAVSLVLFSMAMMLSNWIGPLLELELRNAMNSKMKCNGSSMGSSSSGEINSSPYSVEYQYNKSSLRAIVKFSTDQPEHVQIREVGLIGTRDNIYMAEIVRSEATCARELSWFLMALRKSKSTSQNELHRTFSTKKERDFTACKRASFSSF